MAVLEDSCSGFFFFLSTKYIFTQVDEYPYERDKCQQIILIINLILTIFLLICSLWSTLIVATRRLTIFGGCEKKATFPKKNIVCSTYHRTPDFALYQDQNTKEIWLAIQSAPYKLNKLNTTVNEKLLDFRQQILQLD